MVGLNIGSGQRRFDTAQGWVNIDCVSRPPDQVPDLVCDVQNNGIPYEDGTVDFVVLHQVYEHFGLGEGHGVVKEANRVLRPGGSLILTVPDMRRLAERWLTGQIDDYIYFVNMYGAYQGEAGDRHKWGYDGPGLCADIKSVAEWALVGRFNWRNIPGADIARDWWILGVEAVKSHGGRNRHNRIERTGQRRLYEVGSIRSNSNRSDAAGGEPGVDVGGHRRGEPHGSTAYGNEEG